MEWLNYHHLLYFTAVVDEGGLAAAADRLGVTHPTVSEQVKKLEAQLGLQLFHRKGRRLQLTEDGKMVHGYAGQIFGIGSALLEAVEGRRVGSSVLCRVGVDSVLPKLMVSRCLAPMVDGLGSALRLRCVEDERAALLTSLRGRQLDLVLSDGPAAAAVSSPLTSTRLATSKLGLFAAPALARALKERFPESLDGAPFLLPMPATRFRRDLERWLGSHRLRPHVAAEMEDSALIKIFGQEGRGVFATPLSIADEVIDQYGVALVGVAEGVTSSVFAIGRDEPHRAVDLVRDAARAD
ncbi:MAG: LysR family transcriptional regulator [Myxococcota bacterium]